MAGGYRCSLGHTWNPPNGVPATACPHCGDTMLVVVRDERSVFVLSVGGESPGGQDATLNFPPPAAHDEPPTVAFVHPGGADTPDPSFSSLAGAVPAPSSDSGTVVREPSSVVPFGAGDTSDFVPPQVPGYEILYEVGRGGMGVVYKARQLNLNRTVALKMILSGAHAGPTERERFKREAEAVAALQSAHIVQIFDIGEANGHPYLALEFVEGGSLAQHLTGAPWTAARAAELIEVLARAMQFAHAAGIVHRDLKPGNVLLAVVSGQQAVGRKEQDSKGSSSSLPTAHCPLPTDVPKVTDFGLAKRLDETLGGDGGTRTGAVMGTPSYIAPEQAGGKTRDIGPAADVYALGAILYELLTGRPPFRGETPLATVLQVLHDDPVPPKRLHPLVPRDLETICLKCLSKPQAQRYASASDLADDLRRFLNGEPIRAPPLGSWGRGVKWARRHPSLAVLLGVTVAATVALVTVLSVAYFRVRDAVSAKEHERLIAQRERDRAEGETRRTKALAADNERQRNDALRLADERKREADRTRRVAYALQLAQVAILCERDPPRTAALLEDEAQCPPDLRDFAWHYLRRLCQRDDRAYLDHGAADPLHAVAYAPGGAFVATAGDAGRVRVWDPRTGRTWVTLTGHAGAVSGLAFSPDGTTIASAGADGTVRLWVLPLGVIATARKASTALPWLPQFVDPIIGVPDIAPAVTLAAHEKGATCAAFAPDGRALVSGGGDGFLRWWDLSGWRAAAPDLAAFGGAGATAVTFARAAQSPDARPVWPARADPGEPHHPGGVTCVAFAQNGRFLASGGNDRFARVLSADGAKLIRTLPEHDEAVTAVAVSPDGRAVATANNGATPHVRLFDTQTWRDRRLVGHAASIFALAISDDGQLLASAGFDKTVRLWDTDDGRERGRLVGHAQRVSAVAFAPDRRTIVSAAMDGAAVVWQTATRTHEPDDLLRLGPDPAGRQVPQALAALGMNNGGTALCGVDDLGRVRMGAVDYVRPGETLPPGPPGPLALRLLPYQVPGRFASPAAAVSPDGRTFVVTADGGLRVWQPFPFTDRPPLPGVARRGAFTRSVFVRTPLPVRALGIDPSGRWLVTIDADGVRKYDFHNIPVGADHAIDAKGELVLAAPDARGRVPPDARVDRGRGRVRRAGGEFGREGVGRRAGGARQGAGRGAGVRPCRRTPRDRRCERAHQDVGGGRGRRADAPARPARARRRGPRAGVQPEWADAGLRRRRPRRDPVGPGSRARAAGVHRARGLRAGGGVQRRRRGAAERQPRRGGEAVARRRAPCAGRQPTPAATAPADVNELRVRHQQREEMSRDRKGAGQPPSRDAVGPLPSGRSSMRTLHEPVVRQLFPNTASSTQHPRAWSPPCRRWFSASALSQPASWRASARIGMAPKSLDSYMPRTARVRRM